MFKSIVYLLIVSVFLPATANASFQVTGATITALQTGSVAAQSLNINVALASTAATGNAWVRLQLQNPDGVMIGKAEYTAANASFAAAQSVPYQWNFTLPYTAASGTYTLAVSVYTAHWASELYTNAAAASYRYEAVPFTVKLVSTTMNPGIAKPGDTVDINAVLESNTTASGLEITFGLHDPSGATVAQWVMQKQYLAGNLPHSFDWHYTVPGGVSPTSYALTIAVAAATGATQYLQSGDTLGLAVLGTAMCATPTASKFNAESVSASYGLAMHGANTGADYDLVAASGAGIVRTNLYWSDVETSPGVYDFSAYDPIVANLVSRNLTPMLILGYGNPLYSGGSPVPAPATWKAAFVNYAKAAAAHYQGKGILWEIWNEPDGGTFWVPPSPNDYANLVIAASPAIRAADPSGAVIGGATSGVDWTFVQAIAQAGVLPYVDAISVHPYRHTEPETVLQDLATLRAVMESAAPACARQTPILSSEWGYSTTWNTGPRATDSAQQQGYFLQRAWLMGSYVGLPVSIYYDYKDDGTDPTNPEDNFGTLNADASMKPAYQSAQGLATALQGFTFSHPIPTASAAAYSMLFLSGSEVAVVNWTDDAAVITDPANIPVVTILTPSSANYASYLRSAEITYPHDLLMAAPGNDVLASFVIHNNEAAVANIQLSVGATSIGLTIAPGHVYSYTQELAVTTRTITPTQFPVTMTWNGTPVTDLPAVQVANMLAISGQSGFPLSANCATMHCYGSPASAGSAAAKTLVRGGGASTSVAKPAPTPTTATRTARDPLSDAALPRLPLILRRPADDQRWQ
jgi:hypothetical protein